MTVGKTMKTRFDPCMALASFHKDVVFPTPPLRSKRPRGTRARPWSGPGLRSPAPWVPRRGITTRTVYWFAPDTPTTSKCYGSCAAYWPPVTGTAAASPGVPGRVGTIT